MVKELRILILEDVASDAELMERELRKAGISFTSRRVDTKEEFITGLKDIALDVILADYSLPQFTAMDAFRILKERRADTPFILVTGSQGEEVAVECIKEGMDDYILKTSLKRLPSAMLKAIEKKKSKKAERMLVSVLDATSDFVGIADMDGNPVYLNRAGRSMLGIISDEDISGIPIIGGQTERLRDRILREALPVAVKNGIWGGESVMLDADGNEVPVSQVVMAHRGPDKKIEFFSTIARDISEIKKAEDTIRHMAYHDHLTGLPNRLLLKDRLDQAFARGGRGNSAVLYIDVDNFKIVNDTNGHSFGDEVLKMVAERLLKCVRDGDTVARQGGDEFTVFLKYINRMDDVIRVVERILSAFETTFAIDGREHFLTASIGVSVCPDDGEDAETLLKNADIAMYNAKAAGRNTYRLFSSAMNDRLSRRHDLEVRLRKAVDRREFLLHYQPEIDLKTWEITGMEALLRWQEPERGLIPPLEFIPLAEDTGLITPIGEWVLRTACLQNRQWQERGLKPVHVATNLSMRQFRQKNFIEKVAGILDETGLAPERLELELTESLVMEDAESIIETLGKLRTMGIKLTIDDFGTGYSSLEYIKRMPIDMLKIAQPFVKNIANSKGDAAIATTIIKMGHSLDIEVIAEGVETVEQLDILKGLDCDKIQGFFVSRPLPPDKMEAFLQKGGV